MPSNAETERWAVDTSVAVAFLDAGHSAHELCLAALRGRAAALSGHATFESYSVLTRLPEPNRVSATDARRGLEYDDVARADLRLDRPARQPWPGRLRN
jgi:hypothetical protein